MVRDVIILKALRITRVVIRGALSTRGCQRNASRQRIYLLFVEYRKSLLCHRGAMPTDLSANQEYYTSAALAWQRADLFNLEHDDGRQVNTYDVDNGQGKRFASNGDEAVHIHDLQQVISK